MTTANMQRRAAAVAQARAIADAAEGEGRQLTPDEAARIDRLWTEVDSFDLVNPRGLPLDADCDWSARA
jgi:hypothetical protein